MGSAPHRRPHGLGAFVSFYLRDQRYTHEEECEEQERETGGRGEQVQRVLLDVQIKVLG